MFRAGSRLLARPARCKLRALGAVGIAAAGLVFAGAKVHTPDVATSTTKSSAAAQRQREGATLTDVPGHFKMSGDRATFYPSDNSPGYPGLENLNLERITVLITENPAQMEWLVSGALTEFRGSNYLLISKAVLKGSSDAPDGGHPRPGAANRAPSQPASARGATGN